MPRFGQVETEGGVVASEWHAWRQTAEIVNATPRHDRAECKFTVTGAPRIALAG